MTFRKMISLALMLSAALTLAATDTDKKVKRLRQQTSRVQKMRRQTGEVNRDVQSIRTLMEASGVMPEETLTAVQKIVAEIDGAANKNFKKALIHIAEARDDVAKAGPHLQSAIKEQDAAEKALAEARRQAMIRAELSRLIELLTRIRDEETDLQGDTRKTNELKLEGKKIDGEQIAEKQLRLGDRLEIAQKSLDVLRAAGEMPKAKPQDAGKRLEVAAHAIAQNLEDEQYAMATTGQTNLIAWIDRILTQLEEQETPPQSQSEQSQQQQQVQQMIEQLTEQNEQIEEFDEQNEEANPENEEFNELMAEQQEITEDMQEMNQQQDNQQQQQQQQTPMQQAQAQVEQAQQQMEQGNMEQAQQNNERARQLLEQAAEQMAQEEQQQEEGEPPPPEDGQQEQTAQKGGGEEPVQEVSEDPNFKTNTFGTAEVTDTNEWTRDLGENEKKDMRQGARAEGPKAYESLANEYFEAMGAVAN